MNGSDLLRYIAAMPDYTGEEEDIIDGGDEKNPLFDSI